jgi:hypothetical protein
LSLFIFLFIFEHPSYFKKERRAWNETKKKKRAGN